MAVDASSSMIELAKKRVGEKVDVRQADLRKPLTFLDSASFDVVLSSLTMAYIEDWHKPFEEFYRVLRPTGQFVLSVSHPLFDYVHYKTKNYFETELVGNEWHGFAGVKVQMPSFRRSLEATLNPLIEAGFRLDRVLEPKPK